MRVLVTGARDWPRSKAKVVWTALSGIAAEVGFDSMVVVHGACPSGADHWADLWANTMDTGLVKYRADWQKLGKAAGMKRNQQMVDAGADICLAFIARCVKTNCRLPRPHDSHGTADCIKRAEKAGIEVRRYYLNGKA